MASNDYHFITHWYVRGTIKEVFDILNDAEGLVRWWPSTYLEVKTLKEGDERGLGKQVELYIKGWLPYTMRWKFTTTEIQDAGFTLQAHGDFEGRGIWTFKQKGDWVDITYDWLLSAQKPLLRYFSFLLRPVFTLNHHWVMDRGEESLKLEIARRAATTPEERAAIPAPPPPTDFSFVGMAVGAATILTLVAGLGYWLVRQFTGNAFKNGS